MWEEENSICIDMDVPGIAFADLDVSMEKGRLTIRGMRRTAKPSQERKHEERFFGQFERTVVLNEWVDPSTITATLSDGVLHLKMSKRPESQRQKIAINYNGNDESKRIESSQ